MQSIHLAFTTACVVFGLFLYFKREQLKNPFFENAKDRDGTIIALCTVALIFWYFGKFASKLSNEFIAAVGMVFTHAWAMIVAFHYGEKKGRERQ